MHLARLRLQMVRGQTSERKAERPAWTGARTHALVVAIRDNKPPLGCSLVGLELRLGWLAEERGRRGGRERVRERAKWEEGGRAEEGG